MKLIVDKGELTLPEDFSFEIEQNSAFFSEDGAASIATTIPATPSDLEKLDHPTRIARRTRFFNLFPAVLTAGVFQKKGTLVVNSASEDGLSCAMALEDSDFYSNFKEKNLKDIFAQKVLTTYNTPEAWYNYLFQVYKEAVDCDFRLIPVAVNYADGVYQINNEPYHPNENWDDSTVFSLRYEARLITENGEKVNVPVGYGIAPFLKLYIFFERLFELCGYTVRQNCFRTNSDLSSLILLHNCSDVLCNGRIDYSDLVPNKTISDILEWMRKKFLAQIVVYPSSSMVDIVLLEDILAAGYDKDLSGKLLGKITTTFSASSRIVITPDTSLEGAAPAAETMEDLLKKYGSVTERERGEASDMGLTLDLATGVYSEAQAPFSSVSSRSASYKSRYKVIGTNYFSYDRRNSKESVSMDPSDLMPPMVFVGGYLMPFIGDRKHRNTQYNDSAKDEDQEIIIVEYAGRSIRGYDPSSSSTPQRLTDEQTAGLHYFYGTTQKYNNRGRIREGRYNLNAPEMYQRFFRGYNKMLLNNLVKIEGLFNLSVEDILSYQMYSLKLFQGQQLLPVSLQYEVGRRIKCLKAVFYHVKDYEDGQDDTPTTLPAPSFKWELDDSQVQAAKAAAAAESGYTNLIAKYIDDYATGEQEFFLPAPTALNQFSAHIPRTVEFGYYYSSGGHSSGTSQTTYRKVSEAEVEVWFYSVAI